LAELKGIELVDGPFEEINQFISGIAGADSEEIKEVETLISALPKELQQELVDEGPGSTIFEKLGMLAAEMVEKEEALGNLLNVDFAGEAAASSAEDFPEVKNAEEHFRIRVVMPGIKELERVFSMPSDATFFHLHLALQEFFDWDNEHLFDFSKGKGQKRVEVGLRCGDLPLTTRIDHFANNDGSFDKFSYTYDFSDEWEHQITIGKRRLKPKQPTLETRLISGKGVAPLEDCGGIPGHYAILDGTHPFCEELETEFFESYSKEKFDMKNYSSLSNQGLQKSYGYHLECGMF